MMRASLLSVPSKTFNLMSVVVHRVEGIGTIRAGSSTQDREVLHTRSGTGDDCLH